MRPIKPRSSIDFCEVIAIVLTSITLTLPGLVILIAVNYFVDNEIGIYNLILYFIISFVIFLLKTLQ